VGRVKRKKGKTVPECKAKGKEKKGGVGGTQGIERFLGRVSEGKKEKPPCYQKGGSRTAKKRKEGDQLHLTPGKEEKKRGHLSGPRKEGLREVAVFPPGEG